MLTAEEIVAEVDKGMRGKVTEHVHVISRNIEILHDDLYNAFKNKYGMDSVVFSINSDEVGKMFNVISREIEDRRKVCKVYDVLRVSELDLTKLTIDELDITKKLFLHVLMPRYVNNKNISLLKQMMLICIPLGIHLVIYHPSSVREDNFKVLNSASYWTVYADQGRIENKKAK